jgi:hypothetical protein
MEILGRFTNLFHGKIIKDYGVFCERQEGRWRLRISATLHRRAGNPFLRIRTIATGPLFSWQVTYATIDASPPALSKLSEVLTDAYQVVLADASPNSSS